MAAGRGCEPNFSAIFIYFNISFVQSIVCNVGSHVDEVETNLDSSIQLYDSGFTLSVWTTAPAAAAAALRFFQNICIPLKIFAGLFITLHTAK